ncbi:MAG: S8 family serine peptidase [Anaerolineales bacterium]|nr:S8 family serine peptidase [Anaerolineales bacterium]MCB9127061.1 S8 family serine peptidase [Ardenticatenales bacterium]MCB9172414.1 S8 family serine peptidase [Ardenticatenales bacterium]
MNVLTTLLHRLLNRLRTMTNARLRPDIVVYGTISLDNVIRLPERPADHRAVAVNADYYSAGGVALMTALPLAEWGHRVRIVGNELGEDAYGDSLRNDLARYQALDATAIATNPRVRTPFTRRLTLPSGDVQSLAYWHEAVTLPVLTAEQMDEVKVLSVDGSSGQRGVAAAELARRRGVRVVSSDVSSLEDPLIPLSDWIVVSEQRLQQAGMLTAGDDEALLHRLRDGNEGAMIVLTRGPESTLLMLPSGEIETIPSYPLPALDRMGAGEVFKAGVIRGLLWGMPRYELIRFANAAAARWVAQPAALKRPPTLAEINSLQEERGRLQPVPQLGDQILCPICQHHAARALFEKHWQVDRRIVRAARDRYPAWRRVDGLCPACVRRLVDEVGLTQATVSLPASFARHPIYGQEEPQVLPTGVRLRANPHYTGRGVRMAFLDSGFYPHPDLMQPTNRILDFVDASNDEIIVGADFSVPQLSSWHGTMTSVAAAGNGFLSQGYYAGLASEAELLLIRVMTDKLRVDEVDILRGLRWLADHWRAYGIQIVNISLGGDEGLRPESELNQLVNGLVEAGLVVVAAAGNAGEADLVPPASAADAITVGGVDDQNTLDPTTNTMWHSNWGHIGEGLLKPELLAPSIWVAAPVLPGTPTAETLLILDRLRRAPDEKLPELMPTVQHQMGWSADQVSQPPEKLRLLLLESLLASKYISPFYQHVDGTSFAAPIVSAVAAQMLEANPTLTPRRLKALLIATAQPLHGVPEERQGYGVVMPGKAVAAALHEHYATYHVGELSPQVAEAEVRFLLREPNAATVHVVGDWNGWRLGETAMAPSTDGWWSATLDRAALPANAQYKFVIDGERWLDDPENLDKAVDGYGGFNGVIRVEDG